MYMKVPMAVPCCIIDSSVSRLRFSRLPYSAAQQPVQCRLQALVGSMSMAQGTLQLCSRRTFSCLWPPIMVALTMKFSNSAWRTLGSRSVHTERRSLYQLPSGLSTTLRSADTWPGTMCRRASSFSAQSMSLGMFSSGLSSRYLITFLSP